MISFIQININDFVIFSYNFFLVQFQEHELRHIFVDIC